MGNKSSVLGSPRGGSTVPDSSIRLQYKRALSRVPASKVSRMRQIFDELTRQSSTTGDRVDKTSFLRYFPLPGMMGERLFSVFDRDGNGSIDFPEFMTGLSMIYHGTMDEKKKFLFDMYDLDGNGEVSKEELFTMLSYIPAAFKVLDLQDPDEETTATAVATYEPTPEMEDKIRQIVDSVFEAGRSTLTFAEFQVAVSRNSAISEIINIFYDESMPENELGIDPNDSLNDTAGSSLLPLAVSRTSSEAVPLSPHQRCKCPLCEAEIQFVHCMRCGGLLKGNKGVVPASELSASSCPACKLTLPEPRHCFSCGHPLKSTLDERDDSSSSEDESVPNRPSEHVDPVSDDDASSEGIVCSGYLSKTGRATQTKQTRFFILRDCFLYYYASQPADIQVTHPRGVVFLSGVFVSPMTASENAQGKFGFLLKSGTKKRLFFCQDDLDQQRWVGALQRASRTRSVFHHYNLDMFSRPLGAGKFSVVYPATHKQTHEAVAVKVLDASTNDSEDREFLRTELAIVKLVSHENVVRTIDVFESIDKLFIVTERVQGGDLLQRLQDGGKLSEFEGKRTIFALATAIQYLHAKGIIHRDIKPENVLISESGVVKLTDFGLSALVPHTRTLEAPLGTVGYAAPEVLLSMPYDKSVDMWSLGAVTFVVLSGQMPFRGRSDKETASLVLKAKYSFANSKVWDNVSPAAKDFIANLMMKNPSKRMTAQEALTHEWLAVLTPDSH